MDVRAGIGSGLRRPLPLQQTPDPLRAGEERGLNSKRKRGVLVVQASTPLLQSLLKLGQRRFYMVNRQFIGL
jgi:hypothetical protein